VPFGYTLQAATIAEAAPYQTSATPLTEIDVMFLKAGAGAKAAINNLRLQGRGAGLTALTGICCNFKNWTTASTGGTAMTPRPDSLAGAVAAQATAAGGAGGGTGAVTAGSGGGTYRGGCGCGGSGPGGWAATTPDQALEQAAGSAGSIDLYSSSGLASMLYEWWVGFLE
jgi:hypothetical protein